MPRAERASTRAFPRPLLVVAVVLGLIRIGAGLVDHWRPSPRMSLVRWSTPAEPAPPDRPVLYDFSALWCQPCQKMEREVFADAEVAAFINDSFARVRVSDEDGGAEARALRAKYHVEALPTLIVARPAGIGEPPRMEGYRNKRKTLTFLRSAIHR
jgi:thiol:disulfide interchange protein